MTTTEISTAELLPGYYLDELGAWLTLPWPGDHTLPYGHPDRMVLLPPSIGPGVVDFAERWLVHHLTGDPWRYTPAQRRFLYLWYAIDPETGRWLYRSGVKRGAKGTGKDPMAATMAAAEWLGPTKLHDIDGGRVIGEPHRLSLVQIASNSEGQSKDVLRVMNAMLGWEVRSQFGIDAGVTRSQTENGSLVELLALAEGSNEGDPATAVIINESHHMTDSSGGQRLAGVARRNVGKSPGGLARALEFTNAHAQGAGAVAEDSYEAWQKQAAGLTRRMDILYDSREAAPHLRLHVPEELELGIAQAYADSPWSSQERIREEAEDPRTSVAESTRYYFNALPTNEFAWAQPRAWDALADASRIVPDGEPITMFLDCSKSTDATALMGCRINDEHEFVLGVWQRPHGDRGTGWLAPREEVEAVAMAAGERFAVQWFGIDPSPARDDETESEYWAPTIARLHTFFASRVLLWATPGKGGSSVLFDMRLSAKGGRERNQLFTSMAELTAAQIDEEREVDAPKPFTHDGHTVLRLHVHNARRRANQWGMSMGKQSRDSKKLVDLAVSMVGARVGRRLVLNSGKLAEKKRSGVVV